MIQLARLVDAPARERAQDLSRRRSRSRSARPTPRSPTPGSPSTAPTSIPTPPSRCGWPSAWCKGYTEHGKQLPPWTTIGGAYEHAAEHDNQRAVRTCRKSWLERKDRLNLDTPFNFVSTADIIGGNSGSPVVNRKGELVGIIFDGNIQSLVWDFVYTEKEGRAVSVHSAAILEALRKVYDAGALADELGR